MTQDRNKSCEERIDGELRDRLEDMKQILYVEDKSEDEDVRDENFERWNEYPLAVDVKRVVIVQLSTGGPGDQFEVTLDSDDTITEIRYRYLDWFDGAERRLEGDDFDAAERFLSYYVEGISATREP